MPELTPAAVDPELAWLFAQSAAAHVLSPDGNPDATVGELRLTAAKAGLAAVLPAIEARLREQIAHDMETRGPGELRSRTRLADWVRNGGASATVVPAEFFDGVAASPVGQDAADLEIGSESAGLLAEMLNDAAAQ